MIAARINDRWPIRLSAERAEFHFDRPNWEAGRLAHMRELVGPGMKVFDVGAEHGDFTALYRSWVGVGGGVVPIEPEPRMWPSIRTTWEANFADRPFPDHWFPGFVSDFTHLEPAGDVQALARAGWPADPWPTMAYELEVEHDPGFRHVRERQHDTPTATLESLFALFGTPDAVVLDIEGAESMAVKHLGGATPLLWVSVHDVGDWNSLHDWYGGSFEQIDADLRQQGYGPGLELPAHGEGERFFFWSPA